MQWSNVRKIPKARLDIRTNWKCSNSKL